MHCIYYILLYTCMITKYGAQGVEEVSDLDVLLCDEPGSVCQQLVECLQAAEFGGSMF